MTIEITEKATIVKDFGSNLDQLLSELQIKQNDLKTSNLVLDISNYRSLKPKDLNIFLSYAKILKTNNKSFVIVIDNFDFTKASTKINIVPTLQEAYDIIELEEIERDLGF